MPLNKPVVGMSSTASGGGYWLVASDRGDLRLRGAVPRFDRVDNSQQAHRRYGVRRPSEWLPIRRQRWRGIHVRSVAVLWLGRGAARRSSPTPGAPSCSASMSNANPSDGGTVTVNIMSNQPNSAITATAHYKTTTTTEPGSSTNASGAGSVTFDIGHPAVGYGTHCR